MSSRSQCAEHCGSGPNLTPSFTEETMEEIFVLFVDTLSPLTESRLLSADL